MKASSVIALSMISAAIAQESITTTPAFSYENEKSNAPTSIDGYVIVPKSVEICAELLALIEKDPEQSAKHVAEAIRNHPKYACELTKTALGVLKDIDYSMAVIEAACEASPENMRLIAQCAIATLPDQLEKIQTIMAKLDPATGDSSLSGKEGLAKAGMEKGGMEKGGTQTIAPPPNPLEQPKKIIVPPYISPPTVTRITR